MRTAQGLSISSFLAFSTLLLGGACAAPREASAPESGAQISVDRIATTLVDLAARRADLSTIRATVGPFRGEAPGAEASAAALVSSGGARRDLVSAELQREFELALANRLHVVEPRSIEDEAPAVAGGGPPPVRERLASHAVLGDYAVRGGKLMVSVRLVEIGSRLVLSAARDTLPLTWFTPQARAQLQHSAHASGPTIVSSPVPSQQPEHAAVAEAAALLTPAATPREPPEAARAAVPPAPAARSLPPPSSSPVEDFETWRARRLARQAGKSSQTGESAPPQEAPPADEPPGKDERTPSPGAQPLPPAPRPQSSIRPSAGPPELAPFPWRESGRLAQLLRIPPKGRKPR